MKVKVKGREGFYAFHRGERKYPGDEIVLQEGEPISKLWMEEVKPEKLGAIKPNKTGKNVVS